MKLFRVAAVFLTIVCYQGLALATHVVGGDFYYNKLGTNYYQLTIKIYFDCETGNPEAISTDKEIYIGVFDASNNQLKDLFTMTRINPFPVNLDKTHYSCVVPDPSICVDQYTYVKNVYLDPGSNGIILSFQRCCRNSSITNIFDPQSSGANIWVKIPGTNTVAFDNSPVFKELPPNYLCIGAPLVFDHSASDPDGDSLVYELYQPYAGATRDQPRPDNSSNGDLGKPPFNTVIWKFPYNTNNQMGGQPIMQVDSKTGELTVIPSVSGQFAIGIKVKEYRKGVLIGETMRDYQFNVKKCVFDLISVFATPDFTTYSCSDTVRFENKSYKAVDFIWDFGDPTVTNDTSRAKNPIWVYPGNGDYRVNLLSKNQFCEDKYSTTVRIRSKVKVDIGPDLTDCKPTDRIINTKLFDATKTIWSSGQNGPYITVRESGEYWAKVFYGECNASDTMILKHYPVSFISSNDTVYCDSVEGTLTVRPVGQTELKYCWNNSTKDSFASFSIKHPGAYILKVSNGSCFEMDTINIWISGKPKIGPYFFVCNDFNKTLDAGEFIPAATYEWSDGSAGRFLDINKEGLYWVKVKQGVCTNVDYLRVENPVIPLDLGPDKHFCDSVRLVLNAPPNMKSYYWNDLSNLQNLTAISEGKYWVEVFDTNGCQRADTMEIDVTESPKVFAGNDTTICYRSIVELGPTESYLEYRWNTGSNKRNISIQDAGEFILVVADEFGCKGSDTVRVLVDINAMPNELFIPNAFSPNDDALNEYFPFSEQVTQPEFSVKIFNRWGEKIFDSKLARSDHWDGTFSDGIIRSDAFGYLIEYRGCDGDYRRKYGTVNVIR